MMPLLDENAIMEGATLALSGLTLAHGSSANENRRSAVVRPLQAKRFRVGDGLSLRGFDSDIRFNPAFQGSNNFCLKSGRRPLR